MSGMELPLAVMITIPEPWEHDMSVSQKKRDFYQYYATNDGALGWSGFNPFSDGDIMGAVLGQKRSSPFTLLHYN